MCLKLNQIIRCEMDEIEKLAKERENARLRRDAKRLEALNEKPDPMPYESAVCWFSLYGWPPGCKVMEMIYRKEPTEVELDDAIKYATYHYPLEAAQAKRAKEAIQLYWHNHHGSSLKIEGQLEIDWARGVIYFHSAENGISLLRINGLRKRKDAPGRDWQLDLSQVLHEFWTENPVTYEKSFDLAQCIAEVKEVVEEAMPKIKAAIDALIVLREQAKQLELENARRNDAGTPTGNASDGGTNGQKPKTDS